MAEHPQIKKPHGLMRVVKPAARTVKGTTLALGAMATSAVVAPVRTGAGIAARKVGGLYKRKGAPAYIITGICGIALAGGGAAALAASRKRAAKGYEPEEEPTQDELMVADLLGDTDVI